MKYCMYTGPELTLLCSSHMVADLCRCWKEDSRLELESYCFQSKWRLHSWFCLHKATYILRQMSFLGMCWSGCLVLSRNFGDQRNSQSGDEQQHWKRKAAVKGTFSLLWETVLDWAVSVVVNHSVSCEARWSWYLAKNTIYNLIVFHSLHFQDIWIANL